MQAFPHWASLVCPVTKRPLRLCSLEEACSKVSGGAPLAPRATDAVKPVGPTSQVLLRDDHACAYPVVDGYPILLAPEVLTSSDRRGSFDLKDPRYAEAYEEMTFYNDFASAAASAIEGSEAFLAIRPVMGISGPRSESFPEPWRLWLDAAYDSAAQGEAYAHLAPIAGRRIVQVGGTGTHAVKFVLAGARYACLATPMLEEARFTQALALRAGVSDRVGCVIAIGEELPFASESMDGIYSGGCMHHMVTQLALPEAARILVKGGSFAAVDPWRAPLYAIGTRLLGKRETAVYCRPLTPARIAPLRDAFSETKIVQHGTLTRYPFLALKKFGIDSSLAIVRAVGRIDDALCSLIPGLRSMGSSVAVLGRKSAV
jgi:uncharacterized protein YbaR (Trm112 family)/SAM-dependent methyltransferase